MLNVLSRRYILFIVIVLALIFYIFLLVPYTSNSNNEDIKIRSTENKTTVAQLEKTLCGNKFNVKKYRLWKEQNCPKHGFVTIRPGARLGNKMWEYISVWAVARRAGLPAYVPLCLHSELSNAFHSLTVPALEDISHCTVNVSRFAKSLDEWNYNYEGIMVVSNAFQAEIALTWVDDVRKQFTFKNDIIKRRHEILRALVKNNSETVFVGVHVRRTDFAGSYLRNKYSIMPANASFYLSAMKYFEDKYKNVSFIMTSDDNRWCIAQFASKKNLYIVSQHFKTNPYLDLAILAACNHSIYDYGTYGGWAATLAGGETIYYKINSKKKAVPLSVRLAKLLPNWQAFL